MRRDSFQRPALYVVGLTLGEMLVVLAVFVVLAIIFVLSSTQAMVKTKLSRTLQETQLVSRALGNYEADTLSLPPDAPGLDVLTGPVKYMLTIPVDPFSDSDNGEQQYYAYVKNVSSRYRAIIVSVGPDGDSDLIKALEEANADNGPGLSSKGEDSFQCILSDEDASELILNMTYDPTNGIVSSGDVFAVYR